MPSEPLIDPKFEIGHVLFIDIVGYSKLLIGEQSELVRQLKEIVAGTEQVRLAEEQGKLVSLPTGDGVALVFRDSKLTITDVQVKFLTPEIAVTHVRWTMEGAKTPTGIPEPRQGIQTQVLRRQAGTWLIAAFQNTNSVPETPFPQPPAGAAKP